MELDISDLDYVDCRLIVAGSKNVSGQWYMNIYRFNSNLDLLGSSSTPYNIASGYGHKYYGMTLDMDNKVISHLTEYPWGGTETHYGITPMPADW